MPEMCQDCARCMPALCQNDARVQPANARIMPDTFLSYVKNYAMHMPEICHILTAMPNSCGIYARDNMPE